MKCLPEAYLSIKSLDLEKLVNKLINYSNNVSDFLSENLSKFTFYFNNSSYNNSRMAGAVLTSYLVKEIIPVNDKFCLESNNAVLEVSSTFFEDLIFYSVKLKEIKTSKHL